MLHRLNRRLLVLVALATGVQCAQPEVVQAAHARSAALRLQLLRDWTLVQNGTGAVLPSPGYFASFAGAPVQHIVAAMYLNDNATAVRLAQTALADPSISSHFGAVYEWTVVARAFALFNSRSNCSRCARMPLEVERRMQQMLFEFASKNNLPSAFCNGLLPSRGGGSMCQAGSENLDFDAKGSGYLALRQLAQDPDWASRLLGPPPPPPSPPGKLPKCNSCCKAGCGLKCCSPPPPAKQACCCTVRTSVCPPVPPAPPPAPQMTVAQAAKEWDLFFYNKLEDLALSGLYSELGSPNYWYRTYPAIFNLADFGSARVRQRASMFLDLAFVDSMQLQVGGFRAGAKMRSKKDGGAYPVYNSDADPIVAYHAGMGRCAGDSLNPILFGDSGPPTWRYMDGSGAPGPAVWWPHFASRVIEMESSSYQMSPVAILLHRQAAEVTAMEYTVTNRLLGEQSPDGSLSLNSSIVHHFYHNPSFGLGTIFFDPTKADTHYGAPPQESMVGLTFSNDDHTTIGVPHAAGSKWAAQVGGAAVLAKCGGELGCAYDGPFSTEIYNASSIVLKGEADPWVIVEPANGLQAWAAAKYAWGGLNSTASSIAQGVVGSANHSFRLVPNDPTAPLILFAGNGSTFESMDRFTAAVASASLSVTNLPGDSKIVAFKPPGLPEIQFPWSQNKSSLRMPLIGGQPVSATPAKAYDGPFMESWLGGRTVTASAAKGTGFALRYDFARDEIVRL